MAKARNPKIVRAQDKARAKMRAAQWTSQRTARPRAARESAPKKGAGEKPLAYIALPGGKTIPVTDRPLSPQDVEAIINATRPTYLAVELARYRSDLLRDGHGAAARAMTRLIADYNRISRGLEKPARQELRAD